MDVAYLYHQLLDEESLLKKSAELNAKIPQKTINFVDNSFDAKGQHSSIELALLSVKKNQNLIVNYLDDICLSINYLTTLLQQLELKGAGLICLEDRLDFRAPISNLTMRVLTTLQVGRLYNTSLTVSHI